MTRRRTFGTIRKLPSGRYQVRYTASGGVRHRAPRFATKADASRWLASVEHDLARYQHATRDRDEVIAAALSNLIEAASAKVSSELDE